MSAEAPLSSVHTKTTPGSAPNGLGNGLFASEDIHTGEDVLKISAPFVAVLDTPRLNDTCSGCFGKRQLNVGADLHMRACTGCQVVKYCDRACQAKDWKFAHSHECRIFKGLAPRVLPNNARAILQVLLRSIKKKYSNQEVDLFIQLETHIREIRERNMAQWERISLSAKAVKMYSGIDMKEEVISAFGAKLDLNAFNLTNPLYDRIGLYLHPYAALINHSCDYNSIVGFDGDELFVKAVRPIKKNEQIFISYIDASDPHDIRRKKLSERYYFDCQCSKCFEGTTDTPEDSFLTATHDITALAVAETKAQAFMESISAPNCESTGAVRKLESAMQVLDQTSAWPITRQPYISLRDELIASLLTNGQFKKAFVQAAVRYIRVDPIVYPYDSHPIRHVHAWALVRLAIHLSQGIETNPGDGFTLERFELKFSLIIWSLLNKLINKESESCTVPSFKRMVQLAFYEVHKEFVSNGLDPSNMADEIEREWKKMEGVVSATLERK